MLTMVSVSCLLASQGTHTASKQVLNFQFTPSEAISLANTLRAPMPHTIGFRSAVCEHLQEALEATEGDVDEDYAPDSCETDSECEGIKSPAILAVRGK